MASQNVGEVVSPKAAAEVLGLSVEQVKGWIKSGRSPFQRVPAMSPCGYAYQAEREAIEAMRDALPRCREPTCDAIALGSSRACKTHAGGLAKRASRQGRVVICEDCGATRYYSPSHPGAMRCIRCYVASERFSENLADAHDAAAAWRGRLATAVDELKRSRDLLDASQVAEVFGIVSVDQVAAFYVPAGLKAEVHEIDGVTVFLYPRAGVERFKREWIRAGDGRRHRWFDPEKVLSILGGRQLLAARAAQLGISRADAGELERAHVRRRRQALLRHKRGRKPAAGPPSHHHEWADSFAALLDYRERLLCSQMEGEDLDEVRTNWAIAGAIARQDFRDHRARWKGYREDPSARGEMHPEEIERATARVWMAVKPLLGATKSK